MKAEELMIGDWVLTLDSTHKKKVFAQVDAIEEGKHSILVTRECSNWFVDIDWIEPVSLTPEILKKNGFDGGEYKNYCGRVFYLHMKGFRGIGLTMGYKDNILWCERIKQNYPNSIGDKYAIHHLDYVHQLQHALRLCGIEKEIVL